MTKRRCGFTLTEMAIVLGIVGLTFGAVWTAYGLVSRKSKVTRAVTQIQFIQQKIRKLYGTQQQFNTSDGACGGSNYGQFMLNAGVFPSDLLPAAGGPTNSWGGTVSLCPEPNGLFFIMYYGLPPSDCAVLTTAVMSTMDPVAFQINDNTATRVNTNSMTPSQATTACAGLTSDVEFGFSLFQ